LRPATVLLAPLFLFTLVRSATAQMPDHACDAAAAKAERDWNVPAGVLSAVGTVESGVGGGHLGATPWPWTINAAGRGAYFATKEEAIAAVLALMARGLPYIDVGCFQIDLAYHPGVFRSLDEAFDPERNAQAAAQVLAKERLLASDWATAVARYHSATPGLGGPYLERVRAALPTAKLRASYAQLESPADLQTGTRLAPPGSDQQASRTPGMRNWALPGVIYPAPISHRGREPQIIYMGRAGTLPRVIAQNPPGPLR
jgi:hypothetical protein